MEYFHHTSVGGKPITPVPSYWPFPTPKYILSLLSRMRNSYISMYVRRAGYTVYPFSQFPPQVKASTIESMVDRILRQSNKREPSVCSQMLFVFHRQAANFGGQPKADICTSVYVFHCNCGAPWVVKLHLEWYYLVTLKGGLNTTDEEGKPTDKLYGKFQTIAVSVTYSYAVRAARMNWTNG